jgi:hypothetical protein
LVTGISTGNARNGGERDWREGRKRKREGRERGGARVE